MRIQIAFGLHLEFVVQEGMPQVIPAEGCYLGWQESLVLLGKLGRKHQFVIGRFPAITGLPVELKN